MSATPSKFDVVIRSNLLNEVGIGAFRALDHLVLLRGQSTLTPSQLSDVVAGNTVLLCGGYLSEDAVSKLCDVAKSVHFWPKSASETDKYGDWVTVISTSLPVSEEIIAEHAWFDSVLKYFSNDTPSSEKPFHTNVYNGLIALTKQKNVDATEEDIIKFAMHYNTAVRPCLFVEQLRDAGELRAAFTRQHAHDVVRINGREVRCGPNGKYTATMVIAGPTLVVAIAQAAAEKSSVGINVREGKDGRYRFTFCTKDPELVDLAFVSEPPFNGGGEAHMKGCSVAKGVFSNDPQETIFEGMFSVEE